MVEFSWLFLGNPWLFLVILYKFWNVLPPSDDLPLIFRFNYSPKLDVIAKLERIAESVVEATGLFMYGPLLDPGKQDPKRE